MDWAATVKPQAPRVVPDPSTNVDFGAMWDAAGGALSIVRVPLEVLRAFPGFGLLAGGASDLINVHQDFALIEHESVPKHVEDLLAARSLLLVLNNAIGHLVYVDQFVQDGLVVSVVGAEFAPLTAWTNIVLKASKLWLGSLQILLDFALSVDAKWLATKAPPGSQSEKNFQAMYGNYTANTINDVTTMLIDITDMMTGGITNGEVVKTGSRAINAILQGEQKIAPIIWSILRGWYGIYGGLELTPQARPAPGGSGAQPRSKNPPLARTVARRVAARTRAGSGGGVTRRVAAQIILMELQGMKGAYATGDLLLGEASSLMATMMADLKDVATTVTGGKDPFIAARDAGKEALDDLSGRLGQLGELEAMSKTGDQYAADVTETADTLLSYIDELKVPDVEIPEAEFGDNPLADLAEGFVNSAGDVANAALQALVDQVNVLVEEVKPMLRQPVEDAKAAAADIGEIMEIAATEARAQIAWAEEMIVELSTKLGKCSNMEDVFNLMVTQVMQMMGLEEDFEIEDIRAAWVALGAGIDEAVAWAERMRAAAAEEDDDEADTGG